MSPVKKIFFLSLSLILLIVLCVNTHLEKLYKEPVVNNPTPVISEEATVIVEKKETKVEEVKIEEKTLENEVKKEEPKVIAPKEEPAKEIIEEKTEDEPLIITDKKYRRTGNEKSIEDMSINTQLLQIRIRDYVTKYPISFQNSSNEISKKSLNTIKTVLKILKNYPNIKIEVAGHTDAAGKKKFNLGVSISRAVAVKKQMIAYGFDKNRIKARGYGENIPLVENNENGYSKVNRRVEFNIVEE